ncbi:MAG: hypothetical protein GTO22_21475 [Gemmatimonadales bacterium]|nr:hypothetical protein [Gemmatimonadales bacterium]
MRHRRTLITVALVLAIPACEDQPTDVDDSADLQLLVVSGDGQEGPPYTELTEPIVVKVYRGNSQAGIPNQIVNFVVTEGGGSVFAGAALTDALGYAAERWTLGAPGPQALEARAVSSDGEKLVFGNFTATAVEPLPTVVIDVTEVITVSDVPTLVPGVVIHVTETITVSDQPVVSPQ